jgi:hypothetical protein
VYINKKNLKAIQIIPQDWQVGLKLARVKYAGGVSKDPISTL